MASNSFSMTEDNFNATGNSDDLFDNNSSNKYMDMDSHYSNNISPNCLGDSKFRRKKVNKKMDSSSSDESLACKNTTDEMSFMSVNSCDRDTSLYEDKLKKYVFGDKVATPRLSHKKSSEECPNVNESNSSSESILNSSGSENVTLRNFDNFKTPNGVNSVRKVLIKNWLSTVSLNNTMSSRMIVRTENDGMPLQCVSKDANKNFMKVLDETTNIIKNNLCVTPKSHSVNNTDIANNVFPFIMSHTPTPKKKLYSRNRGSFDDEENLTNNDSNASDYELKTRKPLIVDALQRSSTKFNVLVSNTKENNFNISSGGFASPVVRNESKRRRVTKRIAIPSEFKFDEYADSPVRRTRNCDNYFTDSDVEADHNDNDGVDDSSVQNSLQVNNYFINGDDNFDKTVRSKRTTNRNPSKYSDNTDDIPSVDEPADLMETSTHNVYKNDTLEMDSAKELHEKVRREPDDYFTDSDDNFDKKVRSKRTINRNPLNYSDNTDDIPSVLESADVIETSTSSVYKNDTLEADSAKRLDEKVRREPDNYFTDSDESFDKIIKPKRKTKYNPLNYSDNTDDIPSVVESADVIETSTSSVYKNDTLEADSAKGLDEKVRREPDDYFTESDDSFNKIVRSKRNTLRNPLKSDNTEDIPLVDESLDLLETSALNVYKNNTSESNYFNDFDSESPFCQDNTDVPERKRSDKGSFTISLNDLKSLPSNNEKRTDNRFGEESDVKYPSASRKSDLISSIFLDNSKEDSTELDEKIELLKSNQETELCGDSNYIITSRPGTPHSVISISDSADENTGNSQEHFHGDSFDQAAYFKRLQEECEKKTPAKTNNLEKLMLTVVLPKSSSHPDHTSFLLSLTENVEDFMCHPEAKKYKNCFSKNKEELVAILFKLYNKEIFKEKLPFIEIKWSGHLTTTSGITRSSSKINKQGVKERKSMIKLSKSIVQDPEKLRDVLLHELCHAANWLIDQQSAGHGPMFRKWANLARSRFPEIPKVTACHRYELKYKYKYRCTYCGYEVGRMKLVVKEYSCGLCGGTVVVDCL